MVAPASCSHHSYQGGRRTYTVVFTNPSDLERVPAAFLPFSKLLGLVCYILVNISNHVFLTVPQVNESAHYPAVQSFGTAFHNTGTGGLLFYCISIFLPILCSFYFSYRSCSVILQLFFRGYCCINRYKFGRLVKEVSSHSSYITSLDPSS